MVRLRRSSGPPVCLALILGLALAWPGVAHLRFHQHTHDHAGVTAGVSTAVSVVGSESQHSDHPHLNLIATAPTKASLPVGYMVSEDARLNLSCTSVLRVSIHAIESMRPRAPPGEPLLPIRAPPTV